MPSELIYRNEAWRCEVQKPKVISWARASVVSALVINTRCTLSMGDPEPMLIHGQSNAHVGGPPEFLSMFRSTVSPCAFGVLLPCHQPPPSLIQDLLAMKLNRSQEKKSSISRWKPATTQRTFELEWWGCEFSSSPSLSHYRVPRGSIPHQHSSRWQAPCYSGRPFFGRYPCDFQFSAPRPIFFFALPTKVRSPESVPTSGYSRPAS